MSQPSKIVPLAIVPGYREPALERVDCEDCVAARAKIAQLEAAIQKLTVCALPSEEGPAVVCPSCRRDFLKMNDDIKTIGCTPGKRVRRWLIACKIPGSHIHQECPMCSARWVRRMGQERFE